MSKRSWRPETTEEEARIMQHLDPEECEILEAQNGAAYTFPPPANPEEVKRFQRIARNTLAKSERIGLRLTKADLEAIKIRAAKQGDWLSDTHCQSCAPVCDRAARLA